MSAAYLGIDLGGTAVKLGVCTEQGAVLGRTAIGTRPGRGVEDTVDRVTAAARALLEESGGAVACGAGIPGLLDAGRTVLYRAVNLPGWIDVPFAAMLAERLALPTYLENDANCAAWGEYKLGVARGVGSLVLYTLGTGVGGAIVLHDELWVGHGGAAGRFGHTPVDPNGPECRCGQRGCLERYASAGALARRYGRRTVRAVFEGARRGEPAAIRVLDWSCGALALSVANVVETLQPEMVVLAGGMAAAGDLLLERVRAGVRRRIPEHWWPDLRIELSVLGVDAGWIGAALLAARRAKQAAPRDAAVPGVAIHR